MLVAVLDADVLFPMVLRDTLLRAAASGCFRLHWTARILDEMTRNLVGHHGMEQAKVAALRALMEEAFPDADVEGWEAFEGQMKNHPKDRHVAAATAAIGAGIIVTSNVRDFAELPDSVVAMTPDQFLCELLMADSETLVTALTSQAAGYRRPPTTIAELIGQLGKIAPTFASNALVAVPQGRPKPA